MFFIFNLNKRLNNRNRKSLSSIDGTVGKRWSVGPAYVSRYKRLEDNVLTVKKETDDNKLRWQCWFVRQWVPLRFLPSWWSKGSNLHPSPFSLPSRFLRVITFTLIVNHRGTCSLHAWLIGTISTDWVHWIIVIWKTFINWLYINESRRNRIIPKNYVIWI